MGFRIVAIIWFFKTPTRKNKDFQKADTIRLDLEKNGILIEDLNDKTHWKHK